jgi:HPt (histidine-containing phosphotransfer) domain-containing protein
MLAPKLRETSMVQEAIDSAHLRQQTFDDPALQREILEIFQSQSPVLLAALAASDGASRSEIAHRIKGSALAIGANGLADAADKLEATPDNAAHLNAVRRAMAATDEAVAHLLLP